VRAAVAEGGRLHLRNVDEPIPARGQVLVAPYATGICGSDLHLLALQAADPTRVGPIILGHEFCAEVVEYGPETTRSVPVGTAVCSVPFVGGHGGAQLTGLSATLPGACAELMLLQADRLLKVPEGLGSSRACLTEPLAVGLHAVAEADVHSGDCCLVLGAGPIGLAVIAALRAAGHGPVVAAEFSPLRRRLAEAAGADVVVDPAVDSPYHAWGELAGPPLPSSPLLERVIGPPGHTVVFECIGKPGVLAQMVAAAPPHTRLVVVGVSDRPETFLPLDAITKELKLTFAFAYRPREFRQALRILGADHEVGADWITSVVPIERADEAIGAAGAPADHAKVLIEHRRNHEDGGTSR
jgi:2-desacetyl-2-hydroxyethyl bacteriochlorophyllide A dehydrogenase